MATDREITEMNISLHLQLCTSKIDEALREFNANTGLFISDVCVNFINASSKCGPSKIIDVTGLKISK